MSDHIKALEVKLPKQFIAVIKLKVIKFSTQYCDNVTQEVKHTISWLCRSLLRIPPEYHISPSRSVCSAVISLLTEDYSIISKSELSFNVSFSTFSILCIFLSECGQSPRRWEVRSPLLVAVSNLNFLKQSLPLSESTRGDVLRLEEEKSEYSGWNSNLIMMTI